MSMKQFYMTTVAGFAVIFAASSALANQIVVPMSNPLGGGEPTLGTPGPMTQLTDITSSQNFAKFNSSLGTLTSATFQIYLDIGTVMTVINSAALGGTNTTGTINTKLTANLLMPNNTATAHVTSGVTTYTYSDYAGTGGNNNINAFYQLPVYTINVAPQTSVTSQPSDGLDTFDQNGGPISYSKNTANPTDLAAFQSVGGVGNESLTFLTFTTTSTSTNGGNSTITQVTNFDLAGQVTYNYTPTAPIVPGPVGVPEPMSAAVLMAGLAGLAGIRRRR